MVRSNYIPVRFSDRELESIKRIGEKVDADNTSSSVRFAVAYTTHGLAKEKDSLLEPGETVVILPEKLIQKIEALDMPAVTEFSDRVWALLFKWELQ